MGPKILAEFTSDHTSNGQLTFYDLTGTIAAGPFSARGRGVHTPRTDTTYNGTDCDGDTPTGTFDVNGTMSGGVQFGPYPRLVLQSSSGDAAARCALACPPGPETLRVHGGSVPANVLRGTRGCIRLFDVDMKSLLDAMAQAGVLDTATGAMTGACTLEVVNSLAAPAYPPIVDVDPPDPVYPNQ